MTDTNRVAYFEMSFEILEEALKKALNMPADVHILDVAIEHNIMYQPTKRTLIVKVEGPDFDEILEGQVIPRKQVQVNSPSQRWEFR